MINTLKLIKAFIELLTVLIKNGLLRDNRITDRFTFNLVKEYNKSCSIATPVIYAQGKCRIRKYGGGASCLLPFGQLGQILRIS